MAITSPITDFTTTCDDGSSDQYFSGKDAGYRCAWAFHWVTGQTGGRYPYAAFKPEDWVTVNAMDTTLLDYELTDVAARNIAESAEATYQLTGGNDESKRAFLIKARNNYPTAYWWVVPPPSIYLFRVDQNPTGWTPADYSGSEADLYWSKYKAVGGWIAVPNN